METLHKQRMTIIPMKPGRVYSLEEVSYHCDISSCWIVIMDRVYDLTNFVHEVNWMNRVVALCKFDKIRALCVRFVIIHSGNNCRFWQASWKHSKSFQIFFSNQKLARALTSTPNAIEPANTSCCLATSGTNTAGSVPSRRRDFAINWYLFPRLLWFWKDLHARFPLMISSLAPNQLNW